MTPDNNGQRKELPHAFMPTPNDSMTNGRTNGLVNGSGGGGGGGHSNGNGNTPSSIPSSSLSRNLSSDSHISEFPALFNLPSSATGLARPQTQLLRSNRHSEDAMSYMREGVSSASAIPHFNPPSASAPPSTLAATQSTLMDNNFWFDMHQKVIENHDRERELWKQEREQLLSMIESLRRDLAKATTSSTTMTFTTPTWGSKENQKNDKVFYDSKTVSAANEKLRQFSVVSNESSSRPSGDPSEGPEAPRPAARQSSSQAAANPAFRLSSITEDESSSQTPDKRVSISLPVPGPETQTAVTKLSASDPPSPPTTGVAGDMTPPPTDYVKDAGHTPIQRARSPIGSDIDLAPTEPDYTQLNIEITAKDGTDDDKELASPKILPTTPDEQPSSLEILNKRLERVANNPEESQPEVVRSQSQSPSRRPHVAPEERPVDGGPRLKTRRSLNFGTQLGSLR